MPTDAIDIMERLEDDYADAHTADAQPEWTDDLRDAHDAIESAFVRVCGPVPFPRIELEVYNQAADETGWHRIELSDGNWGYAYDNPPAGVVAAQEFLEECVNADAFEAWWREHVGFGGDE
ncbi:hypothetical protein [Natrinema versiforme]|uniref:Uncharacterized protein n=1 Tax=Natrinema versiforme JCM 10478 TaxID=1227496 RepID=L9Y7J6_9EURY|nr:hypothetical protein [Natrinema versiforme]ELY68913.1 hypothetical protein C489_06088 [Natrinema versiforme JCM 10478]